MKDNTCDIVVLSCDAYSDLWEPFFILKERYWKDCKFETYLVTETKSCKWCITLNVNEQIWSKRVREGLKQLKSDYVIILLEDFFIRSNVDTKRIDALIKDFPKDAAVFNFEKVYENCDDDCDIEGFKEKSERSSYKCSLQAALWDRKKLIELLSEDCTPWAWETQPPLIEYDFYINNSSLIIDYGYYRYGAWFGVRKGQWVKHDIVPLFRREKIRIKYKNRGFAPYETIPQKIRRRVKGIFQRS